MHLLDVVHRFIVYCTSDCLLRHDLELKEAFCTVYVDKFLICTFSSCQLAQCLEAKSFS